MRVEWAAKENFSGRRTIEGPVATAATGLTARVDLRGLPADQTIFYRVWFEGGEAVTGRFRTNPAARRTVRFCWSGDTCGQGYGINPDRGGIRIYETIRRREPDFFLHSGDTIYADNPIPAEVKLPGGAVWRNITTEAKSKVAETLDEFRGNYLYNLMDENVRRFHAEVPQVWQWDDHEVVNNWSPGKDLSRDARYREKDIHELVRRARQAFFEHAPIRTAGGAPRVYRRIPYGPLLDLFVIDMRSHRAANSENRQPAAGAGTVFLGREQLRWLESDVARSRAVWKVIASDMPLGLQVGDGKDSSGRLLWEAVANGDGPALGRELEIAGVLKRWKERRVRNVVWLTADVHYTAAHYYDPGKAQFTEFDPFYEFVSGPLHAGTFGPGHLDNTFGPQVLFSKAPPSGRANLPPSEGLQFFGEVVIDGRTEAMTVNLLDASGEVLFRSELTPARA